jgi:hypothetical protein
VTPVKGKVAALVISFVVGGASAFAIQSYINDVELALSCSAVYAALALALALPHICAAMHLSTDAERTTRARYVRWCLEFVSLVKPEPGSAPSKNILKLKAEHIYCVLVAAALPGAVRIAKIDLDVGRNGELGVLGELRASIPSQRLTKGCGELTHRGDQSVQSGMRVFANCPGDCSRVWHRDRQGSRAPHSRSAFPISRRK